MVLLIYICRGGGGNQEQQGQESHGENIQDRSLKFKLVRTSLRRGLNKDRCNKQLNLKLG